MIRSAVEKLIDRYLRGNATPADETLVAQWLDSLAAESSHPGQHLSPQEKELLRRKMLKTIRKRTIHHGSRWKPVGIAAAVAGLLMGGYLLLRLQTPAPAPVYQVFRTGVGEQKMILLPDSSRIWMAPNSELKYPEHYASMRNIILVSGEAFFDVRPDALHQFTVQADSLEVAVLGTSFNVRAYRNLPGLNIAVNTGKIRVTRSGNVLGMLSAGETMQYDRHRSAVALGTFDPGEAGGWKNNRLYFDNTPLAEVLQMLENYYPVKFRLQHPEPLVVSGSLNMKMKPEQVMSILREITGNSIRFTKKSDQLYIVQ